MCTQKSERGIKSSGTVVTGGYELSDLDPLKGKKYLL